MIVKVKDTGLRHYGEVNCSCGLVLRPQMFRLWVRIGALSPAVLQLIRGQWYSAPSGTVVVLCFVFVLGLGTMIERLSGGGALNVGIHAHTHPYQLYRIYPYARTRVHCIFKYIFFITYESILILNTLNMCAYNLYNIQEKKQQVSHK